MSSQAAVMVRDAVEGSWKMPQGELSLKQEFQMVSGTLTMNGSSVPVSGKLRGDLISLTAGSAEYAGRVNGDTMEGNVKGAASGNWSATRLKPEATISVYCGLA